MKINVGSGVLKLDEFINVDQSALPNVDVVHYKPDVLIQFKGENLLLCHPN